MNFFELPKGYENFNEELLTIVKETKGRSFSDIRIERIISTGQVTDWMDQDESEFVVLLSGNAELEFENNRIVKLSPGDSIMIEPREKHRVSYTSTNPPCIWLCVFWS